MALMVFGNNIFLEVLHMDELTSYAEAILTGIDMSSGLVALIDSEYL